MLIRQQAADYLNLSSDKLDRLAQPGELLRVQLAAKRSLRARFIDPVGREGST